MNEIELLEIIKELKKEKRRWYNKIYRLENREKVKEYYQKYKENSRNYRLENKERCRKYRLENKEKLKKYRKTPAYYKKHSISQWKGYGVIHNDFEKLFELYINTTNCENCNILLTTKDRRNTSTTKCLDHCHLTGEFRNVLCNSCNVRRK